MLFTNLKNDCSPQNNQGPVRLCCPACRHHGSFEGFGNVQDILFWVSDTTAEGRKGQTSYHLGQRLCPNPKCRAHVFVAIRQGGEVAISYPAQRIEFETKGIPPKLIETFEEALTCHANACYVAAAIMVRKTMEELCDEQKATGKDLKARIKSLGNVVTLPPALLDGVDHLRLLGNDAAHELKNFDEVGRQELEVAIRLAKEVLKAVYQYQELLKDLQSLKK